MISTSALVYWQKTLKCCCICCVPYLIVFMPIFFCLAKKYCVRKILRMKAHEALICTSVKYRTESPGQNSKLSFLNWMTWTFDRWPWPSNSSEISSRSILYQILWLYTNLFSPRTDTERWLRFITLAADTGGKNLFRWRTSVLYLSQSVLYISQSVLLHGGLLYIALCLSAY